MKTTPCISNNIVIIEPVKSNSTPIVETLHNAKICHFGTTQSCGEIDENQLQPQVSKYESEIVEEESFLSTKSSDLKRTNGQAMQVEGVRGYMLPEFQSTEVVTHQLDVYAFEVVIIRIWIALLFSLANLVLYQIMQFPMHSTVTISKMELLTSNLDVGPTKNQAVGDSSSCHLS